MEFANNMKILKKPLTNAQIKWEQPTQTALLPKFA